MARPKLYDDQQRVHVCSRDPAHRLQSDSERRAIINLVIDAGGSMTIGEIDAHFGYNTQHKVAALARNGWLAFDEKDTQA